MALQNIIPAYLYAQYADDFNVKAFFDAYNVWAQDYLNTLNDLQLATYTQLNGGLLDWVAQGLYGMARPVFGGGVSRRSGALNAWVLNTLPLNQDALAYSSAYLATNDDVFKRILTWHFYKGDGMQFSIPWLKRRVMRFLLGVNGADPGVSNTYPVSVTFGSGRAVNIVLKQTFPLSQVFQSAVSSGALELPFQYNFNVTV